MSKFFYEPVLFPGHTKWINYLLRLYKVWVIIFFSIITTRSFAQSPDPNTSCTSGDLTLVSAILPPNAGDDACGTCTLGSTITRHLILSINNKTGSTRTSFAFWGNLEVYNSAGTLLYTRAITRCKGPIPKNAITPVDFDTIQYQCGQSLKLTNLFLAWTSASPGETCPLNPATINPKCGTLPLIPVVAGLDADFVVASATCTAGGSITVSPFGGKPPYSVTIEGVTHSGIGKDGSTTFTNLTAGSHSITITDATTPIACSTTKTRTIGSSSAPTANAGTDFTKTCTSNATGGQIGGETAQAGFSYSWSSSPSGFTSTSAQPAVNPSVTTTYTLTKTNTTTGCFATDAVTVTVDNATVVADAGTDFTKTCTSNASGGQVGGEAAQAGFSYSWTSSPAGFTSSSAQPNVNPSATTTYTLTKTNTTTGCYGTDDVTVTVDNATVTANAGSDFTKTCTSNSSGGPIGGEAAQAGFSYSWTSSPSGFTSSSAQPTVNPSATTTYTLTKTNTTTGCYGTDDITVTVNNATVTANAGSDFTKTCSANTSGKQIGEASNAGFTYSWSPATGLSDANSSNPTANPSATTTYTVTKTNSTTGCFNTDEVTVTVNNIAPAFTVCVVQPTLCANSGSVKITASGGSGLEYSIDGGANYFSNGGIFSNLGSGSVTGIKVRNSDGCISTETLCNDLNVCPPEETAAKTTALITENSTQTSVKAYPNPFSDRIKFVVTSATGGQANLDVFNFMGQKVKTVYTGFIPAGTQTFELNMPAKQISNLVYVLRIGDQKISGKLLKLNQ